MHFNKLLQTNGIKVINGKIYKKDLNRAIATIANAEDDLKKIKKDPNAIKLVENPTEEMQLEAVKRNGYTIRHIKNPTEKAKIAAVRQNINSLQYIKDPSEEVKLEAVKQNGWAIKFIENPSEEIAIEATKNGHPWAIEYIKNPSEALQLQAVKQNGTAIEYIENPTEKVQLEAIKNYPAAIKLIKNPTDKVKSMPNPEVFLKKVWNSFPSEFKGLFKKPEVDGNSLLVDYKEKFVGDREKYIQTLYLGFISDKEIEVSMSSMGQRSGSSGMAVHVGKIKFDDTFATKVMEFVKEKFGNQ